MKRLASLVTLLTLIVLLVYIGIQAFASDQSRIHAQIDSFVAGFNDRDLGDCLAVLDPEFRDETMPTLDKKQLQRVLRYVLLSQMRSSMRGVEMRIQVPRESREIEIEDGAEQASADFDLRVEGRSQDKWKLLWRVRVEGRLRKVDGTWLLYRTQHRTIEGKRPL